MKKALIIAFFLSLLTVSQAQTGEIIYRDFEPDLSLSATTPDNNGDTIRIDIDQDGTMDFMMYIDYMNIIGFRYVHVTSSWYFRFCYNSVYSYGYWDENDTLVSEPHSPGRWAYPNESWPLLWVDENPNYLELIMGFRKVTDGQNYYAWARIFMDKSQGYNSSSGYFDVVHAYCDNVAYCTIPDYPLRWGQTDLYNDVSENGSLDFVSVLPNPNSGVFTVMGENLRLIEVFNALGQRVTTLHPAGDHSTFDLSSQLAGVYLINVTDQNGKRCVKKVVKP